MLVKFGDAWKCTDCGTRVKPGQPHTSNEPYPHQDMAALTIRVDVTKDEMERADSFSGRPL